MMRAAATSAFDLPTSPMLRGGAGSGGRISDCRLRRSRNPASSRPRAARPRHRLLAGATAAAPLLLPQPPVRARPPLLHRPPEQELAVEVGDVDGVHVYHINRPKAAQRQVFQQLAPQPPRAHHQHPAAHGGRGQRWWRPAMMRGLLCLRHAAWERPWHASKYGRCRQAERRRRRRRVAGAAWRAWGAHWRSASMPPARGSASGRCRKPQEWSGRPPAAVVQELPDLGARLKPGAHHVALPGQQVVEVAPPLRVHL